MFAENGKTLDVSLHIDTFLSRVPKFASAAIANRISRRHYFGRSSQMGELLNILAAWAAIVGTIITTLAFFWAIYSTKSSISADSPLESDSLKIADDDSFGLLSNLPANTPLVGRESEMADLRSLLISDARWVVVQGVGGIGKTALALATGKSIHDDSKDPAFQDEPHYRAFIWTTSKAQSLDIDMLLDTIARTLECPYISQIPSIDERSSEIRSRLAKLRTLLIVDNYETITDSKVTDFLRRLPSTCTTLITTRRHPELENAHAFPLKGMQLEGARELIKNEGCRQGLPSLIDADDKISLRIFRSTGGSPLAIRWAIGQMRQNGRTLDSVIAMLDSAEGDVFDTMLSWAWSMLPESSRQILMTVPVLSTSTLPAAYHSISGASDFDEAFRMLVDLQLLEPSDVVLDGEIVVRFGVHPLTRAYANLRLNSTPTLRKNFSWAATQYFLSYCEARGNMDRGSKSYDEIENELDNIRRVLDFLKNESSDEALRVTIAFSDAINVFFWTRGFWGERIAICDRAFIASKKLNDVSSASRQAYFIGIVRVWQSSLIEAEQRAEQSQLLSEQGTATDQTLAKRLNSLIAMMKGDFTNSIMALQEVFETLTTSELRHTLRSLVTKRHPDLSQLELHAADVVHKGNLPKESIRLFADWRCHTALGHLAGVVAVLTELGIVSNADGHFRAGVSWERQAAVLADFISDKEGKAVALSHLGRAYLGLKNLPRAKEAFLHGLELATDVSRKSTTGRCLHGLAEIESKSRKSLAVEFANQALEVYSRLGMRDEVSQINSLLQTR